MQESEPQLAPEIENKPGKVVVEIGPSNHPFHFRLRPDGDGAVYRAGSESKAIFTVDSGDTIVEVDLLPTQSSDVNRSYRTYRSFLSPDLAGESHLNYTKAELREWLPEGINIQAVHADAQRLPFKDNSIDVIYMANVLSGHIKNQQIEENVHPGKALREKENIIKDIKRALKTGGSLIIEEEYWPAVSVRIVYDKLLGDLSNDPDFLVEVIEDWDEDYDKLVLKLTKRQNEPIAE